MKTIENHIEEVKKIAPAVGKRLEAKYDFMKRALTVESLRQTLDVLWSPVNINANGTKKIGGVKMGVVNGAILEDFVRERIDKLLKKKFKNTIYSASGERKVQLKEPNYVFFVDCVIRRNEEKYPSIIIECKVWIDPNWFLSTACKFYLVKRESKGTKCYLVVGPKSKKIKKGEKDTVETLLNFLKEESWIDDMFIFNGDNDVEAFEKTLLKDLENNETLSVNKDTSR
jgi:hypothetical protein